MAKEKQMTLVTVNVLKNGNVVGTLTKEVPDYSIEQEFEALLTKAENLGGNEVAPSGLEPVVA